jgi:hypothetical protein
MGLSSWLMKRQLKKAEKMLPDLMKAADSMLDHMDKMDFKSFTDHDPFEDEKNDR